MLVRSNPQPARKGRLQLTEKGREKCQTVLVETFTLEAQDASQPDYDRLYQAALEERLGRYGY